MKERRRETGKNHSHIRKRSKEGKIDGKKERERKRKSERRLKVIKRWTESNKEMDRNPNPKPD